MPEKNILWHHRTEAYYGAIFIQFKATFDDCSRYTRSYTGFHGHCSYKPISELTVYASDVPSPISSAEN